ncbi:hypothetical protein [Actinomadura sp. 21ATH]|uniref:hypothetical protein n=1 Tax=Actinomadura sp. 21ATH TaxID=1735444 RepID=UPI0035C0B1EC
MTDYFDTLAERLRAQGMPDERIAGTVDDLAAYAADSGADPREEFGAPEEFAAVLAGSAAAEPVPPAVETWRWTADAFHEVDRLNEFGDQGWEVERVDGRAHFVSRRDLADPQRWEYRRETVRPSTASRAALAERLAPDGWEPCGTWICFEYFKRPKAADLGPAAALGAVPATPSRGVYWSRSFGAFYLIWALFMAAYVGWRLADGDSVSTIAGVAAGGIAVGAAMVVIGWVLGRRSSPSRRRNP